MAHLKQQLTDMSTAKPLTGKAQQVLGQLYKLFFLHSYIVPWSRQGYCLNRINVGLSESSYASQCKWILKHTCIHFVDIVWQSCCLTVSTSCLCDLLSKSGRKGQHEAKRSQTKYLAKYSYAILNERFDWLKKVLWLNLTNHFLWCQHSTTTRVLDPIFPRKRMPCWFGAFWLVLHLFQPIRVFQNRRDVSLYRIGPGRLRRNVSGLVLLIAY